jgi:hypothetical protein
VWALPACTLAVAIAALAWRLAGGWPGIAYLLAWALATVPGWPLGWALCGRRHGLGWMAGGLLGYVLTAVTLAAAMQAGVTSPRRLLFAWIAVTLVVWVAARGIGPRVTPPPWTRGDTAALLLVLHLVPAIVGIPFARIGERDGAGNRLYRAYFTADFLWHVALTAQLTRLEIPPPDPYAGPAPVHYYWTYFIVPATIIGGAPPRWFPGVEPWLLINATAAGLLFVGMVFGAAWAVVPRAGPVSIAVGLAVLAASAEGTYVLWDLYCSGQPLGTVRELNIDAITAWFFHGLTIDGLPRALWYTPQHAAACATALVALVVAARGGPTASASAVALAGVALAGAVALSPLLGGVFALVYGLAIVAMTAAEPRRLVQAVLVHAPAAIPVALAVGWCVWSQMLTGAGGSFWLGFYAKARYAPVKTAVLALGPLLVPAVAGFWSLRHSAAARPAMVAALVGFAMFYLVSLSNDPFWVGWRAGQVLLVTLPALATGTFAGLFGGRGRAAAVVATAALFAVGLPTTIIDAYNAQDVSNRLEGPGFHWTIALSPDEQSALRWLERATPRDAIVQMELTTRGRDTWTLLPTFARRRMAAGLPISLIPTPEQQRKADEVRQLFATTDAEAAWEIATGLGIDYVYLDRVERGAFPEAALAKFDRSPERFTPAFSNDEVRIFAVVRRR